jgi:hypothetical protein
MTDLLIDYGSLHTRVKKASTENVKKLDLIDMTLMLLF